MTSGAQCVADRRARPERRRSLDGLRGVAALVVVLGHVLLTVPALAAIPQLRLHADGAAWWLANTPLRALWNGQNAVLVFFVLSGFVLTLGRRTDTTSWLVYYPSRVVRLYVPVAGALAIAVLLAATVHEWTPVSASSVLRDLVLVRGADGLVLPLWSLQWEVLFSLLLPLYVLFARLRTSLWWAKVALVLVAVAGGLIAEHQTLVYLPVFALGSMLAVEYESGALAARLGRVVAHRRAALVLLVITAVVTFDAKALVAAPAEPGRVLTVAAGVAEVAGALLVVCVALMMPPVRRALERPVVQWLGTRSFSLYLIHWPVLAVVADRVGGAGAHTAVFVALPLSLIAAEVFFRVVERPGHELARWVANAVRQRADGARVTSVPAS